MAKKRNLMEGLTPEDLDFINDRKNLQLNGAIYKNSLKALSYKIDLKCKNQKQKEYLKLIKEKEVVFCSGSSGTGKSWIAASAALELLKNSGNYKKIVIVVPTVQTDLEVGFLKGTLDDKLYAHAEQFLATFEKVLDTSENNGKLILANLIKEGFIEIRCVSFMRGFSIDGSVVIITESQQFPKSAFKTLLTRIGENSKYIFEGDIEQIDNKELKKKGVECGLRHAMERLQDMEEIGIIEFGREDIVRNPIISKILDRFDE
jgi:phosphate starvation-inducible PhoH-like protein